MTAGWRELNWSVLGLGRFGRIHAQTLQRIRGVKLHSVCSRNEAVLHQYADELEIENITTSAAELLTDPEVDIVSIVTHWQDHYQLAIDALAKIGGSGKDLGFQLIELAANVGGINSPSREIGTN